jgi:hypothetical protein
MKQCCGSRAISWVQGFLWVAGTFALGYCALVSISARHAQSEGNLALSAIVFEGTIDFTLARGAGHVTARSFRASLEI